MSESKNNISAPAPVEGRPPVVLQVLPALVAGGVERGAVDIAGALVQAGCVSLVASEGGPMAYELQRVQAEHVTLPLGTKNPVGMWRNVKRLRQLIRARNVDIIHARSRAPAWSAYYAARAEGIHFMTTFHGAYGHGSEIKRTYNSIMARGERVIAPSRYIADHLASVYGVGADRLRCIPRGVDTRIFAPEAVSAERVIQLAEQWRLPETLPLVLLAGRFTRGKGQTDLIHALARMKDMEFACVIAGADQGGSRFRTELEKLIASVGLGDRVWLVDHCNDMAAAYMLANVVVSASSHPESFGRTIGEAQAMGRPVVATDHGGAPEQILAGVTGKLVKPGDQEALAEGIRWALGLSHHMREQIAAAAITNIRGHFTKEQMCNATLAVYGELLG
ncbi:glycosyltransferase family 4 protein [Limibacillus sp. MBR-115]|jgi:glycosyltransferase involved in cell wall biosynthesis|uniref:glycosyltransferase family 4 protein n=1 Tax=Limibacillus sp. MBR-115 TaxID=3156465 RepID=UPI0033913C2B